MDLPYPVDREPETGVSLERVMDSIKKHRDDPTP
jgi:hypothetical protein